MRPVDQAAVRITAVVTAWMDRWWDGDAALLWNPPGAYEDHLTAGRQAHMVRETAWYVAALLARSGPGDGDRAAAAIDAVVATQYDAPGSVADGTFRRFAEDPALPAEPTEWIDYDPNWRQFVGTVLALAAETAADRLPAGTVATARDAVAHAVAGDPPDRVGPWYSNIALMRAWLDAWAGAHLGDTDAARRAERLAAATVARFDRHGTFDEHNSPTYYGIDLYALALWRAHPPVPALGAEGARLEAALWSDVGALYHAGLGNLCGPYDRTYGMDMASYVSDLGLWIWLASGGRAAPGAAPVPGLPGFEEPVLHAHDLCMAPILACLGAVVPAGVRRQLAGFSGERTVRRTVPGDPDRTVTGWLAERCMAGGADSGGARRGWPQYRPATVHWRAPDGRVAWLTVHHRGVIDAGAAPGELTVRTGPHPRRGPQETVFETSVPGTVAGGRWWLPGLDVAVDTDAGDPQVEEHDGGLRIRYPAPAGGAARRRWQLTLVPDEATN